VINVSRKMRSCSFGSTSGVNRIDFLFCLRVACGVAVVIAKRELRSSSK